MIRNTVHNSLCVGRVDDDDMTMTMIDHARSTVMLTLIGVVNDAS